MTAVIILSDVGAQENKICHYFHFFPFKNIYLLFAMWVFIGTWGFSSCDEPGLSLAAVCGRLTPVAPSAVDQAQGHAGSSRCSRWAQWSTGSVVVVQGLSCSVACGVFPYQGSNPCPLHWEADSPPLSHQGSQEIGSSFD